LEDITMGRGLFQPMHLLLILVIVLIIFGPGKLPALGESLGKSIRGFKKAMADKEEDKVEASKMEEKKP
jgi:sec-independent protein translocase protein TatA